MTTVYQFSQTETTGSAKMKLSTTIIALLGVVMLMAVADGKANAVNEEAVELRDLLLKELKAESEATQLEADEDDEDDDEEDRALSEDEDDDDDDEDEENNELEKRVTDKNGIKYDRPDCDAKYKKLKYAPACASASSDFITGGVSKRESREIVKLHNELRGQVEPPASDMLKLSWDKDLAMAAQSWAEICTPGVHSLNEGRIIQDRFDFGENLATSWPTGDWKTVIMAWFDEKDDFRYGKGATSPGKKIGHYTAMVWAKSYKIGCGYAKCKDIKFGTETNWVCHYGPAGNMRSSIKTPYTQSEKGCEGSCRKCKDNLCVCGKRKVCKKRGQYLSPKTCKCQ